MAYGLITLVAGTTGSYAGYGRTGSAFATGSISAEPFDGQTLVAFLTSASADFIQLNGNTVATFLDTAVSVNGRVWTIAQPGTFASGVTQYALTTTGSEFASGTSYSVGTGALGYALHAVTPLVIHGPDTSPALPAAVGDRRTFSTQRGMTLPAAVRYMAIKVSVTQASNWPPFLVAANGYPSWTNNAFIGGASFWSDFVIGTEDPTNGNRLTQFTGETTVPYEIEVIEAWYDAGANRWRGAMNGVDAEIDVTGFDANFTAMLYCMYDAGAMELHRSVVLDRVPTTGERADLRSFIVGPPIITRIFLNAQEGSTWTVPAGVTTLNWFGLGGGGNGTGSANTTGQKASGGGAAFGFGSWSVTAGQTLSMQSIPQAGRGSTSYDTDIYVAQGARNINVSGGRNANAGTAGTANNGNNFVTGSGVTGTFINGINGTAQATASRGGSGGPASAGQYGVGKAGGASSGAAGSGGGGTNGGSSTVGVNGAAANGGNGGIGPTGTAGGVGATTTVNAQNGANGSGGGAGRSTASRYNGANGGNTAAYTDNSGGPNNGASVGFGGGGGGSGSGSAAAVGGAGGYGAGGGGGGVRGNGGAGWFVIQYIDPNPPTPVDYRYKGANWAARYLGAAAENVRYQGAQTLHS